MVEKKSQLEGGQEEDEEDDEEEEEDEEDDDEDEADKNAPWDAQHIKATLRREELGGDCQEAKKWPGKRKKIKKLKRIPKLLNILDF